MKLMAGNIVPGRAGAPRLRFPPFLLQSAAFFIYRLTGQVETWSPMLTPTWCTFRTSCLAGMARSVTG